MYPSTFEDFDTLQGSIKQDFLSELNKFMLSMTQTESKMHGKTVLFVPQDALLGDFHEGARKPWKSLLPAKLIQIHFLIPSSEVCL